MLSARPAAASAAGPRLLYGPLGPKPANSWPLIKLANKLSREIERGTKCPTNDCLANDVGRSTVSISRQNAPLYYRVHRRRSLMIVDSDGASFCLYSIK